MKSYGTDLFAAGKAKNLATKNQLPEKVVKNLIETSKIRDERFGKRFGSSFSHERRHASVWGNVGGKIEPRLNLLHQCH